MKIIREARNILDGKYTILGKVIDGADSTLDSMEKVPVNAKSRPLQEITLQSVTVHANPVSLRNETNEREGREGGGERADSLVALGSVSVDSKLGYIV